MDSFFAVSENIPLVFLDVPFLAGALSSFLTGVAVTCLIIFSRQNREQKKTKPAEPRAKICAESCATEMEAVSAVSFPDAKDHKCLINLGTPEGFAVSISTSAPIVKESKSDPLQFTLRQSLMFWNYTWSETDPLVEVTLDEAIDDFKTVLEFYKSVMVCTQTISRPTVAKWLKEADLYSRRLDENGKMKTFVQIKEFVTAGPEIDAAPFVMHWPFSNTI